MVRHDSISILIPSDTIFADTSKNYTIRFDTINRYINIVILSLTLVQFEREQAV